MTHRRFYWKLVWSLFAGNTPAIYDDLDDSFEAVEKWPRTQRERVIELARAQLSQQTETVRDVSARAQALLTTSLALLAALIASLGAIWAPLDLCVGVLLVAVDIALIASSALLVGALLGSAAVLATRRAFESISTTIIIREWGRVDERRLARETAECVPKGVRTQNALVTVFGTSVRLMIWSAVFLAGAWILSFASP